MKEIKLVFKEFYLVRKSEAIKWYEKGVEHLSFSLFRVFFKTIFYYELFKAGAKDVNIKIEIIF